ncbi:MAG: MBL fold metallo-hydrolase, partial [Flavobacteriaceae bacterium]|nr:MBL fold metallo-hydrolase [Flavobacteriaceae bacterium]
MKIKQFEYAPLSHFSYAVISEGKMAVIDPERDPMQYYTFAEENDAQIVAVFETHPHADFVSSHLQIHQETGATIYCSSKTGADYPHSGFDDGEEVTVGAITFTARNTPGHSPDSITIIAREDSKTALFTGDTLFVGDVGRPDLREKAGHVKAKREELAKMMYDTMQNKFSDLPDNAYVYPAHGAGSLCGKGMSKDATSSTLGNERVSNWAFKDQTEAEFMDELLDSQPFIPHYFGYDVDINKTGAEKVGRLLGEIPLRLNQTKKDDSLLVIDTRNEEAFKEHHLPGSINIMGTKEGHKFETWLGSIVQPDERFYLVVPSVSQARNILERTSKIGYETQVEAIMTLGESNLKAMDDFSVGLFKKNPKDYTVVDIRNESEVADGKFFEHAIAIPLHELRERTGEIPTEKPIVVHCAGGYRSAAGSSILDKELDGATVYDLS